MAAGGRGGGCTWLSKKQRSNKWRDEGGRWLVLSAAAIQRVLVDVGGGGVVHVTRTQGLRRSEKQQNKERKKEQDGREYRPAKGGGAGAEVRRWLAATATKSTVVRNQEE